MAGFQHHPNRAPLDPLPPPDTSHDYFTSSLHCQHSRGAAAGHLHPSDAAYLEELARKLAAFGLLRPAATTGSTSFTAQFEGLGPDARLSQFRSAADSEERRPVARGRLSQSEVPALDSDRRSSLGFPYGDSYGNRLRQVYPINLRKRLPSEVELIERIAMMQQRRRQALAQSRMVVSVSRRACSGTGVFLPRVNNNDCFMDGFEYDGVKTTRGLEAPAVLQPSTTSSEIMANQGMPYQAPPEPNLPAEWTY